MEEYCNVWVGLSELLHDGLEECGILTNRLCDLLELRVLLKLLELLETRTATATACEGILSIAAAFTDLRDVPG